MGRFRSSALGFFLALVTPGTPPALADEYVVTVQKLDARSITFTKPTADAEEGGPPRRGRRGGGGSSVTLPVAADVQVTTATHTRRTGDFHVGTPVGGGLKNSRVQKLEPGTMARVVTDGKQVIELNIVLDTEDGNTVVAVPPKPAPKK
jgi:hypothetical protein